LPPGAVGELYLGGAGLARGYLGRPDLTAERFLPNPFAREPGERLYRTGDRVRRLRTGELDYLGRTDHQVKLRGFRIELGEIEARLREHEAVQTAVVVVREDRAGDPRLVAYAATDADAETLRAHLAAQLPAYMVPAVIVVLDALPLNANGKIDRKALPAPEGHGSDEASYVAPSTREEVLLAELWQDLLGVERVGVTDNFFALGGHSLLAMRLVSRLRSRAAVELPIRRVFEQPTIAGLASSLRALQQEAELPLVAGDLSGPQPLSYAQQRLWFLYRLEGPGSAYNMPYASELAGEFDLALLQAALQALVTRHAVFRTRIVEHDGEAWQLIDAQASLALPLIDLSALPLAVREVETRRLAAADAKRPFVLEEGRLLRASVVRQGPEQHALLLNVHHIIADGWSLGVFATELGQLLQAMRKASLRRWPHCRCNTQTSHAGSANGSAASGWNARWRSGVRSWRICRRCWSCRRTRRARRSGAIAAGRGRSRSMRSCARPWKV